MHSVAGADLPEPPIWGDHLSNTPEWWTNVADEYESSKNTNFWRRILDSEKKIRDDAGHGLSVTAERWQLIKYATFVLRTSQLKGDTVAELEMEIADTYSSLGDYRRSIVAYSELLSKDSVRARDLNFGSCFLGLAMDYERIGDRERALEVYKFMEEKYEGDEYFSEYSTIGRTGIACLTGAKMGFSPPKPAWWGQFQTSPDWLTNLEIKIPQVACFRDGEQYIASTVAKEHDPRNELKAWQELSQSVPLTYQEKTRIYLSLAAGYSESGDYHRSIVYGWRILDEYSSDVLMCKPALKWMRIGFEKLGDTNEVAEVQKSLDCYSKQDD